MTESAPVPANGDQVEDQTRAKYGRLWGMSVYLPSHERHEVRALLVGLEQDHVSALYENEQFKKQLTAGRAAEQEHMAEIVRLREALRETLEDEHTIIDARIREKSWNALEGRRRMSGERLTFAEAVHAIRDKLIELQNAPHEDHAGPICPICVLTNRMLAALEQQRDD